MIGLTGGGRRDVVMRYVKEKRATFPVAIIGLPTTYENNRFARLYGHAIMGTTYVLDANGRIVFRELRADEDDLRAVLTKLSSWK